MFHVHPWCVWGILGNLQSHLTYVASFHRPNPFLGATAVAWLDTTVSDEGCQVAPSFVFTLDYSSVRRRVVKLCICELCVDSQVLMALSISYAGNIARLHL